MSTENPLSQERTPSTIPPNIREAIAACYQNGMMAQAKALEKSWGIDVGVVEDKLKQFITVDGDCVELKRKVRILSGEQDAVLIQGETGTGKELIAEALHGERKGKFVALNCAGLPRELVESELFGHVQGAFTGANVSREGLIETASGGTLFLDEIGDLPLDLQAKFLRVLQNKRIRKVGAKADVEIDVRFIAASHMPLLEHVRAGKFRQDLYARLSTFTLTIKPLRERLSDIPHMLDALEPKKKMKDLGIDWSKVDLSLNVRSLQAHVRRWQVFNEKPSVIN